jgi:hypothetical protein
MVTFSSLQIHTIFDHFLVAERAEGGYETVKFSLENTNQRIALRNLTKEVLINF